MSCHNIEGNCDMSQVDQGTNATRVFIDKAESLIVLQDPASGEVLYINPSSNAPEIRRTVRMPINVEASSIDLFVSLACNKHYPDSDQSHRVICHVCHNSARTFLDNDRMTNDSVSMVLPKSPIFDLLDLAFTGKTKSALELADMIDAVYLYSELNCAGTPEESHWEKVAGEWERVCKLLRTLQSVTRRSGTVSATATRSVQSVSRELEEECRAKDGNELVELPEFGELFGCFHREVSTPIKVPVRIKMERTEDGLPPKIGFVALGINHGMLNEMVTLTVIAAISETYSRMKADGQLKREMVFA